MDNTTTTEIKWGSESKPRSVTVELVMTQAVSEIDAWGESTGEYIDADDCRIAINGYADGTKINGRLSEMDDCVINGTTYVAKIGNMYIASTVMDQIVAAKGKIEATKMWQEKLTKQKIADDAADAYDAECDAMEMAMAQ